MTWWAIWAAGAVVMAGVVYWSDRPYDFLDDFLVMVAAAVVLGVAWPGVVFWEGWRGTWRGLRA